MSRSDDTEPNPLILKSVFPDARSAFAKEKSLPEIKNDCYVVIDTNALFVPYKVSQKSLDQIRQTYAALIADKRLDL